MSHKDALRRLIPIELGGVFADDLVVEGAQLDLVPADLEALRQLIITDITTILPLSGDRIKLTPVRWDIKKPFYVALAASMGYTIRIDDYTPSMADWMHAGDEIVEEPWQYFTAGISMAGDYLAQQDVMTPWIWEVVVIASLEAAPSPGLEAVLNDLRPAHFHLNFTYL